MKRVFSLLLSLSLFVAGCGPAQAVAKDYLWIGHSRDIVHGHTAYADMVLSYPDPDTVIQDIEQLMERILGSSDLKECSGRYEAQVQAYNRLVSATSLSYVRYCQDMTDPQRAEEYGRLNAALYIIQGKLAQAEKVLMDRWGYHHERGEAYANELNRRSRQNDELGVLRSKEDELCRRYERLSTEYRATYQGRTWSMAELMADEDLSLQEFLEALEQFEIGKNEAAATIFVELISLRKRMARQEGYPSYAAGQYALFGRTYAPEQTLQAAKIVKQVFVPLYIRLRQRCDNDLRYLSGATFREDEFISAMEGVVDRVLPGAGEAWRYMLAYGLYDSRPSERKLKGSFTTYLASYDCPFLFTQWKDDASSVFTVIHEFGHFLSYYLNPEGTYYAAEDLDLAETDAQGFEWLMLGEYDAIFGRYADAAKLCFLTNALYAILSGFMEDEFQQRVYLLGNPTVEDLNRIYGEVAASYGFDELFGYEGREWTEIGHTFQFPFYYVSYGVSMLGAMSLVRGGKDAYGRVVHRKAGTSFRDAVGVDVFSEETIRNLAVWVENTADGWLQG